MRVAVSWAFAARGIAHTLAASPRAPITNRLLASLPAKERERLFDRCELVELSFEDVVGKPGESIPHVYFPTSSFISLVSPMGGKSNLEIALAGNEGMFGVPVALGVGKSTITALVQGAGSAWRFGATSFRRELAASPALQKSVNRYIHVLLSQLAQTAGCTRFHFVEERLARWLLMTSDRAHTPTFRITHEFLAFMLGVRRVGITKAAGALQDRKLISYSRGEVTILDRPGLEKASCRCYQVDLNTYRDTFR
jgi:CRP-like cAMP-binding protein